MKKKVSSPPWWCRAALYAATWPRMEFYEYRISMQRSYVRALRGVNGNSKRAQQYARRAALDWTKVALLRVALSGARVLMIFRTAN